MDDKSIHWLFLFGMYEIMVGETNLSQVRY
jgi:hypothetical protein